MDSIEMMLQNIEPIIMNCSKTTRIPSWELDDYMQEGMIIALEMYQNRHNINNGNPFNFYVYFKVRYTCYLIDSFRKANAYKRKFDQPLYCEISEAFNLYDHHQNVADNVCYNLLHHEILEILTPDETDLFMTLKNGGKVERNKKYRLKKKIIDYLKRMI